MKSTAFDMAMVAYRQNDMESAFRQFLSLAEAQDADAMNMVANMFERGQGTYLSLIHIQMCIRDRCLSLACEEVCRIFFSKTKPVKFVEQELFGDSDDDQGVTEEEAAFFEEVQRELIAILQDLSLIPIQMCIRDRNFADILNVCRTGPGLYLPCSVSTADNSLIYRNRCV